MIYVDTSALVRCYFPDEPDHEELRSVVLEGAEPVVTSELTRVELASAASAAHRAGRIDRLTPLLQRFDADCGVDGPIALLALEASVVVPRARELVVEHPLRTLDALHLAVADTTVRRIIGEGGEDGEVIVFVTRDERQHGAASALGLEVR